MLIDPLGLRLAQGRQIALTAPTQALSTVSGSCSDAAEAP